MRTGLHNNKFSVHAIAGTHVITLAFDAKKEETKKLLGFAIHRTKFDKDGNDISQGGDWMKGYKPFQEVIPKPQPKVTYPTNLHPIQSFTWADYAVEQDKIYKYKVIPVFGKPEKPEYGDELEIDVKPELYEDEMHEIYFNRGSAASQAYAIKFDNLKPDDESLTEKEKQERLTWLSRGLFEAICEFIRQAKDERYGLHAALYELDEIDVMREFKKALDNKVDVKIVYEARKGLKQTEDNQETLKEAEFNKNDGIVTFPRKNTDKIPHNKFIVLLKDDKPLMVWTGSTNISMGGIFGHSNVGHCVKNKDIAEEYETYWQILSTDPDRDELVSQVNEKWPYLKKDEVPNDKITPIFSPRTGNKMLETYAELFNSAKNLAVITLPFNLDEKFASKLEGDSEAIRYVMLNSGKENIDIAKKYNPDPDVIVAAGSKFEDVWGQWLNEIHTGYNGSNCLYIHTKFMLIDPLGPEPMVITGSANFSKPSTSGNDENMLIIPCSNEEGKTRVQDIYLGEFFRLFDHWYFRYLHSIDTSSKTEQAKKRFLKSKPADWVTRYFDGKSDQYKRREIFKWGWK